MTQRILLGTPGSAELFALDSIYAQDDHAVVPWIATTEQYFPHGWWGEATFRTGTLIVNSNAGFDVQLTPILDGVPLDGSGGPFTDCRVTVTVPVPASAGRRVVSRYEIGLFQRMHLGGVERGRSALRGTTVQFMLELLTTPVLPDDAVGVPFDIRFDGLEIDYTPKGNRQPTIGPTT
jgi:hypothetical protein